MNASMQGFGRSAWPLVGAPEIAAAIAAPWAAPWTVSTLYAFGYAAALVKGTT